MARTETYPPGSFCWAELATTDTESAKKFYGEMFGWQPADMPIPGGVYTIFKVEGNDTAAMFAAAPGMPTHWGLYFSTPSADDSAAKIAALGGKVLAGPFDVMDAGRMVAFQDPQGAVASLWQANKHIGITHPGPFNRPVWPELGSPDAGGAVAFYSALLGWKTKPESGFDSAEYIEWINGGQSIGGLLPMRGDMWKGIPPHWQFYVTVTDCDERAAKAKELGAGIIVPPRDIPNVGRFSVIRDAQGAVFSLIQMTGAQQSGAA